MVPPMRRAGRPEEIAGLVSYLFSDEAAYLPVRYRDRRSDDLSAAQGGGHPCPVVIPAYNEAATIRDVVDARSPREHRSSSSMTARPTGPLRALPGCRYAAGQRAQPRQGRSIWRGAEAALAAGGERHRDARWRRPAQPGGVAADPPTVAVRPGAIVVGARLHAGRAIPRSRYCANRFATLDRVGGGRPIDDSQSGFRYYPATVFRTLDVRHDRRRRSCSKAKC